MVRIKFFATLREITGKKEMEMHGVSDVAELLDALYRLFGEEFRDELRERSMILVNGKNILDGDGLQTKLSEEDEVSIFPPAGGG